MSKKFLVLASFSHSSGAPMAALRLARGLRERGHETHARFLYDIEPISNPDHTFETFLPDKKNGIVGFFVMVWRTWRFLSKTRPDVIITFLPLANVVGQVLARFSGIQKRIVSHRVPVSTYTPLMQKLDTLMSSFGFYTDIVAVSASVEKSCSHYSQKIRNRTHVVYNGLLGFEPSKIEKKQARQAINVNQEDFVLVAVGRLMEQKNFLFLLPILAKLENTCLVLVGEGEQRSEIEAKAQALGLGDRLRLFGALPKKAIPDVLAAADLFIQPSLFEGQSNALLEAFYAGLPAIVSDAPEQVETLQDEGSEPAGAALPLSSPDLWITALREFRDNPSKLEQARVVARQRAEIFSYSRMIDGFESVIDV